MYLKKNELCTQIVMQRNTVADSLFPQCEKINYVQTAGSSMLLFGVGLLIKTFCFEIIYSKNNNNTSLSYRLVDSLLLSEGSSRVQLPFKGSISQRL